MIIARSMVVSMFFERTLLPINRPTAGVIAMINAAIKEVGVHHRGRFELIFQGRLLSQIPVVCTKIEGRGIFVDFRI